VLILFSSFFEVALNVVAVAHRNQAVFTCADPKSAKKTVKFSIIIPLLGSARIKVALRMLVKLNPARRRDVLDDDDKEDSNFESVSVKKKAKILVKKLSLTLGVLLSVAMSRHPSFVCEG